VLSHATDKKLKSLDGFLNSSEFLLDIVSSMLAIDITSKIQQMGMQNKNAIYIQQAFQKIKHVYAGNIPNDATVLNYNFNGIGMKITLLVVQYIHGLIQVSDFSNFCSCHITLVLILLYCYQTGYSL